MEKDVPLVAVEVRVLPCVAPALERVGQAEPVPDLVDKAVEHCLVPEHLVGRVHDDCCLHLRSVRTSVGSGEMRHRKVQRS